MNKQFIGQQALQGSANNRNVLLDHTNNGQSQLLFNPKIKFMNKNVFLVAMMLCASMFLLTGCQEDELATQPVLQNQSSIPGDQLSKEQALKEIKPVVQEFLNAQYEYYIDKDQTPRWFNYMESGAAQILQQQIDEGRENLYFSIKYKPLTYTSEFKFQNNSSIQNSGDIWILKDVYDRASLTETYQGKTPTGTDISTFSIHYKEISFQKKDGKWIILSWKENGILDAMPNRWFRARENYQLTSSSELNTKFQTLATSTNYNRTAAVIYAINHVFNPNSNYPDYSVAPYGGDCTNFVSQCLESGGWTQISSGTNRWFHKKGSTTVPATSLRSPSWTGAKEFGTFLSNSTRVSSSTAVLTDLNIGDVVQLISNGTAYHTTIVTKREIVNNAVVIKAHYRSGAGLNPDTYVNMNYFSNSSRKQYKLKNSYWLA